MSTELLLCATGSRLDETTVTRPSASDITQKHPAPRFTFTTDRRGWWDPMMKETEMAHIAFACASKIRVSWTCNHAARPLADDFLAVPHRQFDKMGDCSRQNLKGG